MKVKPIILFVIIISLFAAQDFAEAQDEKFQLMDFNVGFDQTNIQEFITKLKYRCPEDMRLAKAVCKNEDQTIKC